MKKEPLPRHENEPDTQKSLEKLNPQEIDTLPETLGFIETPELNLLRGQLVEAIAADSEEIRELATRYQLLAEEVVNRRQGIDFAKAQIGLIVALALMRRDGGRTDYYQEDLQDALAYAWNERLDDIVVIIEAAIEQT